MIRGRNIKRGCEKLRVLNDAVNLYAATCKAYSKPACELKILALKAIDTSQNIFRNISEGYCRTGGKDYLQYLNVALASSVELHSCLISSVCVSQITETQFKAVDQILHRTENQLIQLIESLQGTSKRKELDSTLTKQRNGTSQPTILIPELSS